LIIEEDPISPTTGIIFLSSTGEKLLAQELEVPNEEEEEEIYFKQLIEEPEELEEVENPILKPKPKTLY